MSWYTIFDEQESLLTSTTTTVITPADWVLVHSNTDQKKHKALVGGIQGYTAFTTSTSSSVNIPAISGNVVVTAATSNAAIAYSMLSTPAAAGIVMNFFNSSSTSTFNTVQSESTVVNFFMPGATAGGGATMQFSCSYQSFGIVSGFSTTGAAAGNSTSLSWFVTYRSTSVFST